jgi:replicative DNA helicase
MARDDLEQSVLGAILLIGEEELPPWATRLTPESFAEEQHKTIMMAVDELIGKNQPVDIVTVGEKLDSWGMKLSPYLAELSGYAPTAANLNYHSRRLVERTQIQTARRRLSEINRRALMMTPDEIREQLRDTYEELQPDIDLGALTPVRDIVPGVMRKLLEESEQGGTALVKTGIKDLDARVVMEAGDLTILAARPAMGKTALAGLIARNAARNLSNGAVAIFSLEMRAADLIRRMMSAEARVDSRRLAVVANSGGLAEAAESIHRLDLWIDDRPRLTVEEMRASLRSLPKTQLVVVDYLGLAKMGREERHDLRVGAVTKALKAMAKEFRCHVLALSQLNRDVEKRSPPEPRLSDLRDSGSIEEDADIVLLLYRPGYYNPRADECRAEIDIAKQRKGPTGGVVLKWIKSQQLFTDY